jgi:hypothetical protein
MKHFFLHWVDLTAMLLSIAAAIYFAVKLSRSHPVRSLAAFFLLFGSLVTVVHMFFHLLNVSYNVVERIRINAFTYDFRLYSMYLMGGVLGYLSLRLLRQSVYKCTALQSSNRPMYKTMLAIGAVSLPTVPFTFIGSLPSMGCIVSLIALAFLKRKTASLTTASLPTESNKAA